MPVAENCWLRPSALELFGGVMSIETSVASLTVKVVLAEMPELGWVALIVVLPALTVLTRPLLPTALLIVAKPMEEEAQVIELVRSCVELSV